MAQLIKKGTITSLELLEQINFFRVKEGKKETEHNTLLRTIRDEFEEEIGLNKIVQSSYKNKQNKEMPMFVLTIPQGKQVLARESKFVRKAVIHKLEELENKFKVPTNFKEALQLALEQQEIIEEQQKLIEHKEDVIIGLVEDIDLSTKRQRITQIVRHNSKNYQDRYNLLYKEFEKKYHCDLGVRLESYNNKNKPKMKNRMDYIDRVMNKIPQLYELTCKIFENDVESLKKQWFDIIEDKEVI